MEVFARNLGPDQQVPDILQVLCAAPEYDELPVRHNEDKLNNLIARNTGAVRVQVDMRALDDPHTKASLLLQVRNWIAAGHYRKERKGEERKGKERKGKERKGKERKGKERKGKERKE
eukprot:1151432-Pelagomonas_calceolata.AAC.2